MKVFLERVYSVVNYNRIYINTENFTICFSGKSYVCCIVPLFSLKSALCFSGSILGYIVCALQTFLGNQVLPSFFSYEFALCYCCNTAFGSLYGLLCFWSSSYLQPYCRLFQVHAGSSQVFLQTHIFIWPRAQKKS